jgi:AcrR family transcriptional regulator
LLGAVRVQEQRADLRAARRREILDAAWGLAREQGISALTLREVAARVGIRAPSLYGYFPSKYAIYDAMFAEGYDAFLEIMPGLDDPSEPYARAVSWLLRFFAFCRADIARYQLIFQPAIPGFHPSGESMRRAEQVLSTLDREMRAIGVTRPEARDVWTALVTGMVNQQIANDPAGNRWERLAAEAVEMFMNHFVRMEGRR